MANLSSMQLGKLPHIPKAKDMLLASYLDRNKAAVDLEAAPAAINWYEMPTPAGALPEWDGDHLHNNRHGNCAYAAPAHLLMLEGKLTGSPVVITGDDVDREYGLGTGFDPATGVRDNGAYLRDVMEQWRLVGLYGERIDAYLWINPHDPIEFSWALWNCGGLIGGFALPLCARDQVDGQGNPDWFIPADGWPKGDGPGAWGGHAIAIHGGGNSWGLPTHWTWDWQSACCDELVMPITKRWQLRNGRTPNGLAYADVLADARARGAQ